VKPAGPVADPKAVIDKAINALGGETALGKIKAASWKSKGTISFGNNESEVSNTMTMQGMDHFRQEFEGQFGGNAVKGVTLLAGDKGSRKFGDNANDMDKAGVENQKQATYLQVIPITILPLKDKAYKVEGIADETVDGKPQAGLKVTPADGKEFKIYFDKESGLPVRLVAKVAGFNGMEFTQETTFSDYKETAGIKKATKVVSKRDGQKFIDQQITEFKILDTVDPKTFTDP
jgi:hypothetical protein